MKTIICVIVFIFLITIVLPVFLTQGCDMFSKPDKGYIDEKPLGVLVYIKEEGIIKKMDLEEYITGVVAAEMPASFHIEALKAQAVAARTYTVNRMQSYGAAPNRHHPEADVCTDSTHCQAWISQEQFKKNLRKKFGFFGYKKYMEKIDNAVEDTRGLILVYDSQPIDPLFHSTSGGRTENSEDVFCSKVPYLKSVSSPYEDHSPKMDTQIVMEISEFVKILKGKFNGIKLNEKDVPDAIHVMQVSDGGKIINIKVGNKVLRGRDIRAALNLNSTNFNIKRDGDSVIINIKGYGHGVGMSQYGADGMAKQGSNYKEILKHYYTGIEIKDIREIYSTD